MSDSFRKKAAEQAAKDANDMAKALRKASAKQDNDLEKAMRIQHDRPISGAPDRRKDTGIKDI